MGPSLGQQLVLSRVGKGDVTNVVAEGGHSDKLAPMREPVRVADLRDRLGNRGVHILAVRDDVEDTSGEFHDAQRVLEPAMRCPRVH